VDRAPIKDTETGAAATALRKRERLVFWFLAVVLMPAVAVAVVGGYGFAVWMFQMIAGPPSG
jgi:periplasmic nitrate reductase NapE